MSKKVDVVGCASSGGPAWITAPEENLNDRRTCCASVMTEYEDGKLKLKKITNPASPVQAKMCFHGVSVWIGNLNQLSKDISIAGKLCAIGLFV